LVLTANPTSLKFSHEHYLEDEVLIGLNWHHFSSNSPSCALIICDLSLRKPIEKIVSHSDDYLRLVIPPDRNHTDNHRFQITVLDFEAGRLCVFDLCKRNRTLVSRCIGVVVDEWTNIETLLDDLPEELGNLGRAILNKTVLCV
jgi:hypothetical protein